MSSGKEQPFDFMVGTVHGIKGLRGEIKLKLETNFDLVEQIKSVELNHKGLTSRSKVQSILQEGRSTLLRLDGCNSREDVEALMGALVFTQKTQLRELDEDEWWFGDLIGLDVYTTGGALVGKVRAIVDSGNCLLEIESGEKTHLVPFVKALVPVVDVKAKRLEIEALPGLLD